MVQSVHQEANDQLMELEEQACGSDVELHSKDRLSQLEPLP